MASGGGLSPRSPLLGAGAGGGGGGGGLLRRLFGSCLGAWARAEPPAPAAAADPAGVGAPAPAEAAAAEAVPPAEDAGDAAEAAPEPAAEAEAGLTPEVPAPAVAEIKGESTASVKTVTFAPDLLSPPEDAAKPLLADTPSDVWCTPRGVLGDWTNSPVPLSAPLSEGAGPTKVQAAAAARPQPKARAAPGGQSAGAKKKGKKKSRRGTNAGAPMIAPVAGQKVRAVR